MPRILFNAYDRKMASFRSWYKGKRSAADITQEDLAAKLNVSQAAVSNKVKGKSQITYRDLLVFFDSVNATDEEIIKYMRM